MIKKYNLIIASCFLLSVSCSKTAQVIPIAEENIINETGNGKGSKTRLAVHC